MSYHPTGDHGGEGEMVIRSTGVDRHAHVEVHPDLFATMRDGVRLGADVYLPAGAGPVPAIIIRMPYGKQTPDMAMRQTGEWFARKGYACVVQDVRGKFSSGGAFEPLLNEVDDGYDTVEWAIAQPWCNGSVGFWGESYYGFTSYAAAISGHPAIRAIAPGDIGLDRRATWLRQGAMPLNTMGYWSLSMDAREYADVTAVDPYHLPLIDLPTTVGVAGTFFRTLVDAIDDREWWRRRSLDDRLGEIACPVLSWSGWYDNFLGQQLRDHATLVARHLHPESVHLMVGPWDHEGTAGLTRRAACVPLPDTEPHRWDAFQAFFDHYLRGDGESFGAAGNVDVFTIGRDAWRSLPAWPPSDVTPTSLYLRTDGGLSAEPPGPADIRPGTFRYDPADPLVESVGANCWSLATALVDRRRHDDRADILRYTGEPLAQDLEITGPVRARLYAATSAVDTDFTVTLCHVMADGAVSTIQDGIIRARYRNGHDAPEPVEPGAIVAYDIDLWATSYLVPAGDRLRVDVSSSCFDRFDRNLNTGEPTGHGTVPVVAEQAIHHSTLHPSSITLPVVATP